MNIAASRPFPRFSSSSWAPTSPLRTLHDGTVLLKPPLLALVFADDSLTIADFGLVTVTNSIPLRHDVP